MPVPLIAPLVGTTLSLLLDVIRASIAAKEMNQQQFEAVKKRIDKEFGEFFDLDWDEL